MTMAARIMDMSKGQTTARHYKHEASCDVALNLLAVVSSSPSAKLVPGDSAPQGSIVGHRRPASLYLCGSVVGFDGLPFQISCRLKLRLCCGARFTPPRP